MASTVSSKPRSSVEAVRVLADDVSCCETVQDRITTLHGVAEFVRGTSQEERDSLVENDIIASLLNLILTEDDNFFGVPATEIRCWENTDNLTGHTDNIVSEPPSNDDTFSPDSYSIAVPRASHRPLLFIRSSSRSNTPPYMRPL